MTGSLLLSASKSLDQTRAAESDSAPLPPDRHERRAIASAVAQVFGLSAQQLENTSRGCAKEALARQVAMYVTHVSCGLNLTDVGTLFDRDRTTVSHACAVVEDRRDDPVFDRIMQLLEWVARELMARSRRSPVFVRDHLIGP